MTSDLLRGGGTFARTKRFELFPPPMLGEDDSTFWLLAAFPVGSNDERENFDSVEGLERSSRRYIGVRQ